MRKDPSSAEVRMLLGSPSSSIQQKNATAFVPSWGLGACTEEANHHDP